MPFPKGWKGGPGRPKGSRNKFYAALDKMRDEALTTALSHAAEKAKAGDWPAIQFLLSHGYPAQKERPIELEVGPLAKPADLVQAGAALLQAMTQGEITPGEATAAMANFGQQRDNIVANVHEERLQAIEDMLRAPADAEAKAAK